MSSYFLVLLAAFAASAAPTAKPAPEPAAVVLPGEGRNCELPGGLHFTYRFASRPQMGMVVLKVQVFKADGSRATDLKVRGRSGMPAMKGAHDTADRPFQLNRKGDYLLPVDIAMPGGWEVVLSFYKNAKRIYRGKIDFEI
ncbi:MAG: hypothetical protein NTY77_04200 [Elusimicrobia bacterium]|nr:hypothetical protein [Elusimicrobiota bacterium]